MGEWVRDCDIDVFWDNHMSSSKASAAGCPDFAAALELAALMSEISEDHYCAGWEFGLEYSLFGAAFEGKPYGEGLSMTEHHGLLELSRRCDGWWVFDDTKGENGVSFGQRYVQMQTWTEMYKNY